MVTEAQAVREAVLSAARQMCAAARTAPKACGADSIVTAILTDHELHALADCVEQIESQRASDKPIFRRDAALVAASTAVVLIGSRRIQRGLSPCGLCGHSGCGAALASGGHCAFDDVDLGIAIGSAAALAADLRIDNRVLYTAGYAAMELELLGPGVSTIMAVPLSVSPRNLFFKR